MLYTLVKSVTLGISGACIIAIFWAGWLLFKLPAEATIEKHKSLNLFVIICVVIAVLSSATGLMNTKLNAKDVAERKARQQELIDRYGRENTHPS